MERKGRYYAERRRRQWVEAVGSPRYLIDDPVTANPDEPPPGR
jgi:hypothetical protein